MNNSIEKLNNGDFKVVYETCVCCFKQTTEPVINILIIENIM